MKKPNIYLDYAAATPLDSVVAKTMHEVELVFANPSSLYASGREAKLLLDDARKGVAMFLQAKTDEVVFTSGATESNNLAILGAARAAGQGHIISIASEHASVRKPIGQLEKEGFAVTWCPLKTDGMVDVASLQAALRPDTVLITMALANGEFGTIQPTAKITKLIKSYNPNIVFHTDASAAAGLLHCDVARLGVDMLSLGGSKVYGPKASGGLYVKRGITLAPLLYGGDQEFGLRPGTEAIDQAVGLARALELVQEQRDQDAEDFGSLMAVLQRILLKKGSLHILGHQRHRLAHVLTISFDGVNGEDIVAYMDAAGFAVATGAACEAAKAEPSPALLALGLSNSQAQGSIRISVGRLTTQQHVEAAAKALIHTLDKLGFSWDN